jgi:hypothetical protein
MHLGTSWQPLESLALYKRWVQFSVQNKAATFIVVSSVWDPDPQDPHVFGPPGSGSISQRYPDPDTSLFL